MKVLLVEDNPGDARLVQEMLRGRDDFALKIANRVRDGLRFLESEDFDVALLDLNLPDSHGLETLTRIRTCAEDLPLVVMTSVDDEALAVQALEHGAEDYLVKGQVDGASLRRAMLYAIQRKRMQVALRSSEERYRRIVETATEGIWIVDSHNRTLLANKSLADMLGYSPGEMLGQTVSSLTGGCCPDAFETESPEARGTKGVECQLWRRDGVSLWALISCAPIPVEGEAAPGTLIMVTDITALKKVEELKDEFVGMVSHELKTPLTVLMGAIYTLTEEGIPEGERNDLLEAAAYGVDTLTSIVDNLLELSRSQANQLSIQISVIEISEVASSTIDRMRNRCEKHRLFSDIPAGLPPVPADRVRVERILDNLVGNAIKYSPAGGDVVVFGREENEFVVIGVKDQGIGISTEDQSRLFGRFQRTGEAVSRGIKGVGLGLHVCRILVEAHSGRIWVESEPGKGSTFFFTLPKQAVQSRP